MSDNIFLKILSQNLKDIHQSNVNIMSSDHKPFPVSFEEEYVTLLPILSQDVPSLFV